MKCMRFDEREGKKHHLISSMHLLGVIIYSLSQRNAGSKFKCENNMQFAFVSERVQDKLHFQSARVRTLQASCMHIAEVSDGSEYRNSQTHRPLRRGFG